MWNLSLLPSLPPRIAQKGEKCKMELIKTLARGALHVCKIYNAKDHVSVCGFLSNWAIIMKGGTVSIIHESWFTPSARTVKNACVFLPVVIVVHLSDACKSNTNEITSRRGNTLWSDLFRIGWRIEKNGIFHLFWIRQKDWLANLRSGTNYSGSEIFLIFHPILLDYLCNKLLWILYAIQVNIDLWDT